MAKPSRDGLRQRVFGPGTVSRESEAAQVVNFLLGDRPLLELSGRSGSGKTTLLDGVAATAEALDYRVLRMWPDPQLASRPWYPVRQMIGELLGCGPTPRTEHRLTELAAPLRLDPDHIDGLKALFGLALVEHSEEGVEQAKLIRRSVAACLAALPGGPSGTCLVADDALEYDRASQRLLRSLPALLGPRLGKLAVVADGAFFASRTDRAHLPLGGLDVDGIASLLEARNTDRNIAEMAQFVADVSAGNTLNVTQAVLAASEGGHLGLPLSEPIAWRIGQLPEADRRMLQVVSALGCQVPMSWLDDLTRDGPAAPVVEALQAKEMVRVDASGAVSPTHATVAALALQRMDSLARDALHGELLDLLKRDGQSVFVLAHHAYEVETEKAATDALDLLTRAGDSARRWADVETAALIHYEKAVQVARWRLLLRDHDPRFVELSLRLGQAQAATDHRRAAEVTLRDVVAGADRDARLAQLASNTLGELSSR